MGIGNTIIDVSLVTLLQRGVAERVLARVFGVIESVALATIALGAILAPLLIHRLGLRAALIISGLTLPLLGALLWPRLRAIDASAKEPAAPALSLLKQSPLFALLPEPTLENLAAHLLPLTVKAGTQVVRQGESGDRAYLVGRGKLQVSRNGQAVATLGPGDYFGEIALLRDRARIATVTAITAAELYGLPGEAFVAAISGHPPTAETADAAITLRLAGLRPGLT